MNTETHCARFTRAIELELQQGNRREPIWNEALITSEGDEASAREHYIRLRVEQLAADEAEREAAEKVRNEKHRWLDESTLNLPRKNALLGAGVALALLLCWFIMNH